MFTPVRKDAFRWETPFPRNNDNLVGHMFLEDSECILIDPPHIPGLIESIKGLSDSVSIILTSQNHTRGTGYIAAKTGAAVYVPDQDQNAVEPIEVLALKEVGEYKKFSEGEVLGMKVFKDFYDFALLTEEGELIVSDNGRGTADGKLALWPEFMDEDPPKPSNETIHKEFKSLIQKTGATTLLAGHGHDIIGNLQELAKDL